VIDWDSAVLAPLHGVFGETVQYFPAVGQPFNITGIFDEAYKSVDMSDAVAMATDMPVLGVRLAEFPVSPKQRDTLVITANDQHSGGTFVVKEVRPDGHGEAKLLLNYVGP
jgi:hypothetical protein